MTISSHAEVFAGFSVRDYSDAAPLRDLASACYRLRIGYEESEGGATMADLIGRYLDRPNAHETRALVIGAWENCSDSTHDSTPIVEALVAGRSKLPGLEALFIGDVVMEESEISWLGQSEMSPIFGAFPQLLHFKVRGGTNLSIGRIVHKSLKSLIIESGGLSSTVVRDVANSDLPSLEHLELWLGSDNYGGDSSIDDLKNILSGANFPNLKHLGLQDSEYQDEIAKAVAVAPITSRLESLNLSMGVLSDDGGNALLDSPAIKKLKSLDLHHHYLSDAMVKKLKNICPSVDLSEQESGDEDDRYIAVSE